MGKKEELLSKTEDLESRFSHSLFQFVLDLLGSSDLMSSTRSCRLLESFVQRLCAILLDSMRKLQSLVCRLARMQSRDP